MFINPIYKRIIMALINFQSQFAKAVEDGTKRQTIRAHRKYPIKTGEMLHLYTECRTKKARKLKSIICLSVQNIIISELQYEVQIPGEDGFVPIHYLDCLDCLDRFAQADGFKNWILMIRWFANTHGLPFKGTLIKW
ncbi:hypothetical protein LCGC14_1907900 [marine sediment metagenome]|uniref:ASCH domain-containing protein n=1 Tax=marine sediment metagenome TaxID=412755 RepID=A0A0F9I8H7_9ZZZZ